MCYQPFDMTLTRSVSGWVWRNIVFGGLIGLASRGLSDGKTAAIRSLAIRVATPKGVRISPHHHARFSVRLLWRRWRRRRRWLGVVLSGDCRPRPTELRSAHAAAGKQLLSG